MTSDFPDAALPIGESTVGEFWRWAFSSLADNATRGVSAEFLVGPAPDVLSEPRVQWDAADLRLSGHLIEVKFSADHQVWKEHKPSVISFDVGKKRWWNANADEWSDVSERPASVDVSMRTIQTEADSIREEYDRELEGLTK